MTTDDDSGRTEPGQADAPQAEDRMSDAIDDYPDDAHTRPRGTSDATVEALGKLSEAFEIAEDARGHLYAFHRLTGQSDLTLGEAARMLEAAGHGDLADQIANELIGRNVLAGRWTFQIVEEYDDGYFALFRALERKARDELVGGRRHLFEAEMKEARRTHGHSDHSARPDDGATLTDTTAT